MSNLYLDFETEIEALDQQIAALRESTHPESKAKLAELTVQRMEELRRLYATLTPWQKVAVARHRDRPQPADLVGAIVDDFVELFGDRRFGDDRAILTGFGKLGRHRVMLVGHRKGRDAAEKAACNSGCAHPEGYRKALLKMKLAEKYNVPIVCLIDTAGAHPGVDAEERGQSLAIAENLLEMSRLRVPIVCLIVGEGGSGGALGIGLGDHLAMLEHAWFSVISPEGCAGILWKDRSFSEQAAEALCLTAEELRKLDVVETIIPEPVGGAHRDPAATAQRVKLHLTRQLDRLEKFDAEALMEARYDRFRRIGEFIEVSQSGSSDSRSTVPSVDLPVSGSSPEQVT